MPEERVVTHSVRTYKHVAVDVVLPSSESSIPDDAHAIVLNLSGRAPVVFTPADFQQFCNCMADAHTRIFARERPLFEAEPGDDL